MSEIGLYLLKIVHIVDLHVQKAASRHSHSLHSSDSQSSSSVHSRGNGDCPSKEREAEENEHQMCSQSEGECVITSHCLCFVSV